MSEEEPEIFLSPAVTYGPPGLDLSCPIAMTIAHCAEVAADNWTIRLKRQVQDNKWEVSHFCLTSISPLEHRCGVLKTSVFTANTQILTAAIISIRADETYFD